MIAHVPLMARGATLVELMIAAGLGIIVIGAVGALFLTSSRAMREDERLSFMNQELGYAIAQLVQDVEMAGHWARLHDPSRVEEHPNLAIASDCGTAPSAGTTWAYTNREALSVEDNATAAEVNAAHPCIPEADVHPGSDVIAIKRVMGAAAGDDDDMTAQDAAAAANGPMAYLRTGSLSGRLYLHDGTVFGDVPRPFENWEYRPSVYYINASVDGTGGPGLCRRVLRPIVGGSPGFVEECLAQGVENMQVEVGVDNDGDGAANYFTSGPNAAETAQIVSVRLYLLARSARPDFNHEERADRVYQLGNLPDGHVPALNADPNDKHYYHRTLSSEVVLRNPRSLQGIAVQ